MAYPAILGRWLNLPVINIGFSGNGKMHKEVGDLMIEVDAAAYVIDCLPNMNGAMVTKRCVPLVNQLREAHADTPIVLVEDRRFPNSWLVPDKSKFHDDNHAALRKAYQDLKTAGLKKTKKKEKKEEAAGLRKDKEIKRKKKKLPGPGARKTFFKTAQGLS